MKEGEEELSRFARFLRCRTTARAPKLRQRGRWTKVQCRAVTACEVRREGLSAQGRSAGRLGENKGY